MAGTITGDSHHARALKYLPKDFIRPVRPPPPQTGLMTWKKLERLIAEGYGQGHLHNYKPFLRVTKRDSSPISSVGHLPVPDQQRLQHFRSLAERRIMLLHRWLGAHDVRDQFPMWPWPHAHPLVGIDRTRDASIQTKGLEAIAGDLGIKHGTYVGTNIPYVATLDVVSTWFTAGGSYVLSAHDCKPRQVLEGTPPGGRIRQRVLLGLRYSKEINAIHRTTHAEEVSDELIRSLDALYPHLGPGEASRLRQSDVYKRMVHALIQKAYAKPAFRVAEQTAAVLGIDPLLGQSMLHLAIWMQDVDHDVSGPLELWNPLIPGGRALRLRLFDQWGPGIAYA